MILLDTHVHIYSCFDLGDFFDSAHANLAKAAKGYSQTSPASQSFQGLLLLTEAAAENWFARLKAGNPSLPATFAWQVNQTQENESLVLEHRQSRNKLFLAAGRQIVTAEGLEVLALCTDQRFADGLSLAAAVQETQQAGGIPVIPWGAGKWLGARGRILKNFLVDYSGEILLGDNGGRPAFWPFPSRFRNVGNRQLAVLPGSDPLPFPREATQVGRFGCILAGSVSEDRPVADLKGLLNQQKGQLAPFGSPENPWRFLRNQFAMQFLKRRQNKR